MEDAGWKCRMVAMGGWESSGGGGVAAKKGGGRTNTSLIEDLLSWRKRAVI